MTEHDKNSRGNLKMDISKQKLKEFATRRLELMEILKDVLQEERNDTRCQVSYKEEMKSSENCVHCCRNNNVTDTRDENDVLFEGSNDSGFNLVNA